MENVKYPHYLSTIFDTKIIRNLINGAGISEVNKILKTTEFPINKKSKLIDKYDAVYDYLLKNYRNEYVFKNTIINKILLGKHSLTTSTAFNEFQVFGCKLDLLVLNGKSKAYEIKTKYDNFSRLKIQLETYLKFFDEVYVVLDEQTYSEDSNMLSSLNDRIGILVFTQKNNLSNKKKAKSNTKFIKSENMVSLLRKDEYLDIIKSSFGKDLSDIPNTKIYDIAKQWFAKFDGQKAHQLTIEKLKFRKQYIKESRKIIETAPVSIKNLLINNTSVEDLSKLSALFQ